MSSPLSALSIILSSGISTIESTYAKHGISVPSMDEPFQPGPLDNDEALSKTISHVIAAASQLIALVKPAPLIVTEGSLSFYLSASLQVAVEANIPEILREAGPQGLHVKDIGYKSGVDPHKIGRILRYLATNYIFKEVSPDVFANNRSSSMLDTGKSVAAIKADPIRKYDNTSGVSALVAHCTDEGIRPAAYLSKHLLDPQTTGSPEPLDCPFSRAFGRVSAWEFYEKPENEYRLRRFGASMHGVNTNISLDLILKGFDWKSLDQDALVVDVGGGIGSSTLRLLNAYPHLRYVVQDRPKVIPDAVKFLGNQIPEALKSGRVELKAHDFFEPQPIQNASVFFVRFVIHNWADAYAKKILRHLRDSAQPFTKLIISDILVSYAAPSNHLFSDIPGAEVPPAPYPLLPNLGAVSNRTMNTDLQMMTLLNAQERTVGQFIDLVDGTGWKLESVGRNAQNSLAMLVFNPITI